LDPNLFAVDGARLLEVLLLIVVLAFVVERALALFFESRPLVERIADTGIKELVAFLVAFGVCVHWDFDALSILMPQEKTELLGEALTGAVIAGGSKAAVKLFHDLMGVMSTAEKERQARKATARAVAAAPGP
jgi:hypothetical protein